MALAVGKEQALDARVDLRASSWSHNPAHAAAFEDPNCSCSGPCCRGLVL